MANDDLAVINGVKPKKLLTDGEEVEVQGSGKNPYKCKRTLDHYHCSCPAWRNQKGVTVDSRTCKHLRSVLGDAYEDARLASKSDSGAPAAGASTTAPKSKARAPASKATAAKAATSKAATSKATTTKTTGKRTKRDEDEDDEKEAKEQQPAKKPRSTRAAASKAVKKEEDDIEDEDENEGDEPPAKKPRSTRAAKPASKATTKPASKRAVAKKAPAKVKKEEPIEEEAPDAEMADPEDGADGVKASSAGDGDELAIINGVKPKKLLKDEEEVEVKGSGKTPYKLKRTMGHYYCTCPAWRNQKGVLTEARTCKHLRGLLGDAYEDARIAWKAAGGGSGPSAAPASTTSKDVKPKSKPASTAVKGKGKAKVKVEDDEDGAENYEEAIKEEGVDEDEDDPMSHSEGEPALEDDAGSAHEGEGEGKGEVKPVLAGSKFKVDNDDLAEINGVKPNKVIKDGEEIEAKSQSSSAVYKIKRTFDHYYCTCPAWRNQGGAPVNARSCKHLRAILGDAYEDARILMKNPNADLGKSGKGKAAAKKKPASKKKKADGDEDDEEDEDDAGGKVKVELLLATKWDLETGTDPKGWWMSEKLDGVRTYWDGTRMLSRLGNPFTPPQWLTDKLPKDVTLDGELFGGRGEFQSTVSIVKTMNSPHWQDITFQIFDVPSMGSKPFEERIAFARKLFGKGGKYASMNKIKVLEQEEVRDRQHVLDKLKEIEGLGGEGVMLRQPKSVYEGKRSNTLLKVKTFYDAEAEVIGYEPGKGKHKGSTGSLKCKMESGKTFNVGTGLSDAQRRKPPKIGAIVVYRFQELTRDCVPRFPSFIGEAADKDAAKDADVPAHRKTNAVSSG